MSLLFGVHCEGPMAVVDCSGALVFGADTTELGIKARELLGEGRSVVLDLGGISRLDSFGVGALFGIYTAALTSGGTVAFASALRPCGTCWSEPG